MLPLEAELVYSSLKRCDLSEAVYIVPATEVDPGLDPWFLV